MVVGGIFVLLGDAIPEAVAHGSDLVHDASFLPFGVISIAEVVGVSTCVNEDTFRNANRRGKK
jgi:hypothetical protein